MRAAVEVRAIDDGDDRRSPWSQTRATAEPSHIYVSSIEVAVNGRHNRSSGISYAIKEKLSRRRPGSPWSVAITSNEYPDRPFHSPIPMNRTLSEPAGRP